MTTGNVKMVAPTESTHVCGLKKNNTVSESWKKKQENVLLTYIWKQANIELVPIKINDDMTVGNVKMVVPTESTLSVD